jgi:hypothetical protein
LKAGAVLLAGLNVTPRGELLMAKPIFAQLLAVDQAVRFRNFCGYIITQASLTVVAKVHE